MSAFLNPEHLVGPRSRSIRATVSGLVLGLVLLTTRPSLVRAQGAPATEADQERARVLVKQARSLSGQGRLREALAALEQAYRHWPHYHVDFNLALVRVELREKVAAATHLRRYLSRAPRAEQDSLPPPLRQLLSEVGVIRVDVRGARLAIWIDNRHVGDEAAEAVVLPGRYAVVLRQGDREILRHQAAVVGGQVYVWSPHLGIVLRAGASRPVPDTAPPRSSSLRRLHWGWFAALTALTVVSGAALIGTGLETNDLEAQHASNPTWETYHAGLRYRTATNVLVGVAAAAGLTAILTGLFTRWSKEERFRTLMFSPAPTTRGVAVEVGGRF